MNEDQLKDFIENRFHWIMEQRQKEGQFSDDEKILYKIMIDSPAIDQIEQNFRELKKSGAALGARDLILAGLILGYQLGKEEL